MPECYIRGNSIKYLRIPDEIIDLVAEEEQRDRKLALAGAGRGGRTAGRIGGRGEYRGGGEQGRGRGSGGRGDGNDRGGRGGGHQGSRGSGGRGGGRG